MEEDWFSTAISDRAPSTSKLLKDNGVLPQHLQDRKDAEGARVLAEQDLQAQIELLCNVESQIIEHCAVLRQFFHADPTV